MEHQPYFVVVLAHSLHGRLRRIQIPQQAIYSVLILAVIGFFSVAGFAFSYARMVWKVAHYNSLRHEVDTLRARYRELQNINKQKTEQLATLQMFASEVSVAYGLERKPSSEPVDNPELMPTFRESLQEYNFLKTATLSHAFRQYAHQWQINTRPSLWPVLGRIQSPFGARTDPFSGEGAIHTGVDISAAVGTAVQATGDGVVVRAEWAGRYGRLVVIDHGNGIQSWYAHLSAFQVVAGEAVRRGDVIALSGASGHVTGPHVHYEIRMAGTPVNPYPWLSHPVLASSSANARDLLD
ncbi:MAG TPA: M23 family metallopeptidase [Bryobacteraceae bacterium]|nr:M23 family metallopeptidase [Bryobacteraceae bacterium]